MKPNQHYHATLHFITPCNVRRISEIPCLSVSHCRARGLGRATRGPEALGFGGLQIQLHFVCEHWNPPAPATRATNVMN